jgi:hypothetical protein
MSLQQVSVFIENKCGRLQEITEILANAGINIIAHALLDTMNFGIVRLIVDAPDKAVATLKNQGLVVSTNEVLAVLVADQPGGFNRLLKTMADHGMAFNYTYSIGHTADRQAVNIFHFDDLGRTGAILREAGVQMIEAEALARYWPV